MTNKSNTIVFFGSGPVAAQSLQLLANNFTVEAVVTKPRPQHHRGAFPVLDTATSLKLPLHTVSNKIELSALMKAKPFRSDLGVLIDFGIIVSQDVIDYFPLGILNSHFSVLPDLRGADPISFAILSGQQTTGVSLMLLVEAMDEGPLVAYGEQPLNGTETTPELTQQLIKLSDGLLREMIPHYRATHQTAPQSITGRLISYSRKLTKDDGVIDWHKPAQQLEREIRAFIDWPKSRARLAGKDVIITKAHVAKQSQSTSPGTITITQSKAIAVQTSQDLLIIERLRPAGKSDMSAKAFLAGHQL